MVFNQAARRENERGGGERRIGSGIRNRDARAVFPNQDSAESLGVPRKIVE